MRKDHSLAAIAVVLSIGCSKSARRSGESAAGEAESAPAIAPMDAPEAAQWAAAADGDPDELMRLEDLVGCDRLQDRSPDSNLRTTAIRAMAYCPDFSPLPWLAEVAAGKNDSEAQFALETIVDLAARARRATDPDDAEELHSGCDALLSMARAVARPRDRRVLAVRALRMLSERGCVRRADVPADVDVKVK